MLTCLAHIRTVQLIRELVEPHPLDFDWRYDQPTVAHLSSLLRGRGPILALGAPSVARALEMEGEPVQLIDRQPYQLVTNHWVAEIDVQLRLPIARSNVAIADPPWYPGDFLDWAIVASRSVGVGHTAYISIWPDSTRPSAGTERRSLFDAVRSWAHVVEHEAVLHYEMPRFERGAIALGGRSQLSTSPRVGSLLELRVLRTPPPIRHRIQREAWIRFVFDSYQLAIRLGNPASGDSEISPHPYAKGWKWPYVSARAPEVGQIGLWSSRGEVATVRNPLPLVKTLQTVVSSCTSATFEAALAMYPMLLDWGIPRPPYVRTLEWRHQQ